MVTKAELLKMTSPAETLAPVKEEPVLPDPLVLDPVEKFEGFQIDDTPTPRTPLQKNVASLGIPRNQDIDIVNNITNMMDAQVAIIDYRKKQLKETTENIQSGFGNFFETLKEGVQYGPQKNISRVSAMLFGGLSYNPYTGESAFSDIPQEEDALSSLRPGIGQGRTVPGTGALAFTRPVGEAPTTVARQMRGLSWAWHERADTALQEARLKRDFDPTEISSIAAESTISVLGSMGLALMFGGLGLGTQATQTATLGTFGLAVGLESYDQDVKEGASKEEARAYGFLKGAVSFYTEGVGLRWMFKNHYSTASMVVDAVLGRGFENVLSSSGHRIVDEMAGRFEEYVARDGGFGVEDIYGRRVLQNFDQWQMWAAEMLKVSAIGSIMAGGVAFSIGAPVNRFLVRDMQKLGVPKNEANRVAAQMQAEASVQTQSEIAMREGIDYDTVEYTNRKLDEILALELPQKPDVSINRPDVPGPKIPEVSDSPVLEGRLQRADSIFKEKLSALEEIDSTIEQAELTEAGKREIGELRTEQNKIIDELRDAKLERDAILSGRAIFAKPSEAQQLVDEGFVPINSGSEIHVPASLLMNIQTRAAKEALVNYRQGVRDSTKLLKSEGLQARRILRDYIKSAEGIDPKVKERLQRRLVQVDTEVKLNRVLNEVEQVIFKQINRMQERALKSGITDIVRRYRKKKNVDVDTKKIFERIKRVKTDPSYRDKVLTEAFQEGADPGDTGSFVEQAMARFYAGHADTVPELQQTYRVMQALYSRGATEANRIAAEKQRTREAEIEQTVKELNAPKLSNTERITGKIQAPFILPKLTGFVEGFRNYNGIMKVILGQRPNKLSEAIGFLNTHYAELAQYELEGKGRQMMRGLYQRAFNIRNKYGAVRRMERDVAPLPEGLQVPLFDEVTGRQTGVIEDTTVADARTAWTYWQNEKAQKAMRKLGYTQESIDFIDTNILTSEDFAYINGLQEIMFQYYVKLKPVYERLTQKPLGFEEMYLPLLVAEDGYSGEIQAASHMIDELLKINNIDMKLDYLEPSQTRSRKGGTAAKIRPDFLIVQKYVRDISHFVGTSEKMEQLSQIYTDSRVKEAIVKRFGPGRYDAIRLALKTMVKNTTWREGNGTEKPITNLTNKLAIGAIYASGPKLGGVQMLSSIISLTDVPVTGFMKGLASFPKAVKSGEINKLREHPFYKYRGFDNFSSAMRLVDESFGNARGILSKDMRAQDLLSFYMRAGDKGAILVNTWALYDHFRQSMPENVALEKAFETTGSNQQSGFLSQLPIGAMNSGPITRSFYKFTSALVQYFNNEMVAISEYVGAVNRAKSVSERLEALTVGEEAKRFGKAMIMYHVIIPTMYNALRNAGELDWGTQAAYMIAGPAANVPFTGELLLNFTQLTLAIVGANLNGEPEDAGEWWKYYSRLNQDSIIANWTRYTARAMRAISDAGREGVTVEEAHELVDLLGKSMTAVSPTGGAVVQRGNRFIQGTEDIMENDYETGLKRYLGFSSYVIDQANKDDKIKGGRGPTKVRGPAK